jgi:hypothetical protein
MKFIQYVTLTFVTLTEVALKQLRQRLNFSLPQFKNTDYPILLPQVVRSVVLCYP